MGQIITSIGPGHVHMCQGVQAFITLRLTAMPDKPPFPHSGRYSWRVRETGNARRASGVSDELNFLAFCR